MSSHSHRVSDERKGGTVKIHVTLYIQQEIIQNTTSVQKNARGSQKRVGKRSNFSL